MEIKIKKIEDIEKWTERIKNSQCGNLFQYEWYLKIRQVQKVLCVYATNENLLAVMPLFESEDQKKIEQSTLFVPYGGPVFLFKEENYRRNLELKRKISYAISQYLCSKYEQIDFSVDVDLVDIIPYIRDGFIPEYRLTYVINVERDINEWIKEWSYSKRYDFRCALRNEINLILDSNLEYFSISHALQWEINGTSYKQVEEIITTGIKNKCAMPMIALQNNEVLAGVFFAWDHKRAYVLYSYYNGKNSKGVIPFLFVEIFKYVKYELALCEVDLEGSVLQGVENFNISIAAKQKVYYNLHWCSDVKLFQRNFYKYYFEKINNYK